jgi:carboxyl-terminal processing protease
MRKRSAIALAVIVGVISVLTTLIVISFVFRVGLFNISPGGEDALPVSEFSNVENIIENYYLHDYDMKEIQYAGLKAMVEALDDPYSVYYTPEEFESFKQDASGEYFGMGMVISMDEKAKLAKVEYFFEGSSAEEAGVKVGDLIYSVNGEDMAGKTLQQVSQRCLGEEGTSLNIGIKRGDEILEFEIIRRAVEKKMIDYKMLDDGIGYMQIVQFGGNCEQLFSEAMDYFQRSGAEGIVIDLRDNPGGYLSTVVNVLDKLLPEGTLVYTEDKNGKKETWSSNASCIDLPITLIVNGNTASAAEIFAGAVQDFGYGEVVGTTTYGKGVVQVVLPIESTGGGIKITTSQYYTPSGRTIDKNGIYPDHYVKLQQDFILNPKSYSFEEDAQVQKAIEVLKAEIGR